MGELIAENSPGCPNGTYTTLSAEHMSTFSLAGSPELSAVPLSVESHSDGALSWWLCVSAVFFLRHHPCGLGGLLSAPELRSASLEADMHTLTPN